MEHSPKTYPEVDGIKLMCPCGWERSFDMGTTLYKLTAIWGNHVVKAGMAEQDEEA